MAVRSTARDFRDLVIWERAHRLALASYKATSSFPREEVYGLTSQIRRAASSVPANIAEGCGLGGNDLTRHCRIAFGSLSELQYHLMLAHDLQFLDLDSYGPLSVQVEELRKGLSVFIRSLSNDS